MVLDGPKLSGSCVAPQTPAIPMRAVEKGNLETAALSNLREEQIPSLHAPSYPTSGDTVKPCCISSSCSSHQSPLTIVPEYIP